MLGEAMFSATLPRQGPQYLGGVSVRASRNGCRAHLQASPGLVHTQQSPPLAQHWEMSLCSHGIGEGGNGIQSLS